MSADLEALVEAFLDRLDDDPELSPETFAAEHPNAGPQLLASLRSTIDVMTALGDGVEPLPERIGPHTVIGELGRGGMGVVYEIEHGGQRRALKRLGVTALLQPNAQQRFGREANALRRLAVDGVVAVHEVGMADGLPFLVMDLVDGPSLEGAGPLPWRRATELCRDLGNALAAIHDAGLCHRDLKPQNVILGNDGKPVIVDFGLVHDDTNATLTGTGDLVGTPRYLAPEQAAGQPTDARTDVHALGLLFAELLTGQPVRRGTNRSAVLTEAVAGRPAELGSIEHVTALRRVVQTATALRPRWRYPTARAMVADLERLLAGEPVQARPPGRAVRGIDAARQHPRRAASLCVGAIALLTWIGLLIHSQLDSARSERASAHFEEAVLAWTGRDDAAARLGAAATLEEVADHAGALTVLALLGDDVAPATAGSRAEQLRAGVVARAAQRWADAASAFRDAAAAEPACPLTRILLATSEERVGRLAEAVRELTTAAELLPDSPSLAAALGALHDRRRDPAAAAGAYRRAVAMRPTSVSLRYRLARALYGFDAEAALQAIADALSLLRPEQTRDRRRLDNLRASVLDRLGRLPEAEAILAQLVADDPDDVKATFNHGYVLDRMLRLSEAKQAYERVLAHDGHNINATLCLVWLLATAADEELRDPDRAEQLLLATLQRDGGNREEVIRMVRDFGLRTGRVDGLTATLTQLMERPGLPTQIRARLEHTRNNLRSGAPQTGR